MRKLFLPGFLGLSMLLAAVLGTAQACVVNGRLFSPPMPERMAMLEADRQKQPQITFKNDGADVIAAIQVWANGSRHALWTTYEIGANHVVTLRYCLIQNRDWLVRSQKTVAIEWRLKGFAIMPSPPFSYRVEGSTMTPNSQELKDVISQLQLLIRDKAESPAPAPKAENELRAQGEQEAEQDIAKGVHPSSNRRNWRASF